MLIDCSCYTTTGEVSRENNGYYFKCSCILHTKEIYLISYTTPDIIYDKKDSLLKSRNVFEGQIYAQALHILRHDNAFMHSLVLDKEASCRSFGCSGDATNL